MRILYVPILTLAAGLGTATQAQLPYPFTPGQPGYNGRPQCTKDYVRSVETQAEVLEKLRAAGPEAIDRLCTMIELGSAWLGGKLTEEAREELRKLLGVDVDLETITAQCRAGRDSIGQELTAMLQRLKAELARCDDTI
jgi:hypothetical protein